MVKLQIAVLTQDYKVSHDPTISLYMYQVHVHDVHTDVFLLYMTITVSLCG